MPKNDLACRNSSQAVKLKIHLLQHLPVLQPWYNVTTDVPHESYITRQDKFVARQKLSPYLVFQLVARHYLNAYDISTLAWDKVRLIQVWRQNHILYHILNIARIGTFEYIHSEGIL